MFSKIDTDYCDASEIRFSSDNTTIFIHSSELYNKLVKTGFHFGHNHIPINVDFTGFISEDADGELSVEVQGHGNNLSLNAHGFDKSIKKHAKKAKCTFRDLSISVSFKKLIRVCIFEDKK